jgi:hypothetical protein
VTTSRCLLLVSVLATLLAACSATGPQRQVNGSVPIEKSLAESSEDQLLDVWIELFDPGELPEDEEEASGLSMDIRKAEAHYIPQHLRDTMEQTGFWGAVRVVPQGTEGAELLVQGKILNSDGERLEVEIRAVDATGVEWLHQTYQSEATVESYKAGEGAVREVFQPMYNAIANDLARFRSLRSANDMLTVRRVATLRFAADLAPEAFEGHLQRSEDGRYSIVRLPAENDPMYQRVHAIRERDFLLIDTLNGHFDNFYRDMQQPYFDWRRTRSEEAASLREIQADATKRKLLGAAAIVGAIAIEVLGNGNTRASTGTLRDVMVLGGAYALKTGFDKDSETTIHREAIEELGESFSAETRPLVVDVEGETHELTGSAEVQYAKWRTLLKRIYASETGFTDSTD